MCKIINSNPIMDSIISESDESKKEISDVTSFAIVENRNEKENGANRYKYVLVAIRRTLCNAPEFSFLVWKLTNSDSGNGIMEVWSVSDMKFWYCDIHSEVDYTYYFGVRHMYFDMKRIIYKHERCIPIDSHHPGDLNHFRQTKTYQQTLRLWTPIFGWRHKT